jgi:hypothetical protein
MKNYKPGDRVRIRANVSIGFPGLGESSEMHAIRDDRRVGVVTDFNNGLQDYCVKFDDDPGPWRGLNDRELEPE